MGKCVFRDGTIITDYGKPYIVAEVNSSHNGDVSVAKQMIDAAVEAGCDCVKFQSWSADSLYSKSYYDANPIAKRFVKKFSLLPEQLKDLAQYCNERGIAFASTPYSKAEVDFLIDDCKAPFIKVSSMELNNPLFLKYIGGKNIPVVLSTGMSTIEEIENGISILENAGATQITILHCVSIYPTELDTINLNNIVGLRERFSNYPIGFSDHTKGDVAAVAAVALGASLIEKHLTLDSKKVGMDNGMATEPEEFMQLVSKCNDIYKAMGTTSRIVSDLEMEQRKKMRRSIVSVNDIKKGDKIKFGDICAKRPGTGISPDKFDCVIGKVALRDIEADTLIMPEDFQ